jgi:ABC-type branched-subunit amino acid transport system substrate-binding protein
MKKNNPYTKRNLQLFGILIVVCCLLPNVSLAQQRQKIAIFTPLYLDSAFDARGELKDRNNFPRYTAAGLEFYLGAQAALDSLEKRGAMLEVVILDAKSNTPLAQQVNGPQLQNVQLIIGHTNAAETRVLADAAARKKVPFVSATLPNDAGIVNNPYFIVLNTTLQSHVEGIYRFLQKHHSADKIIVFRKPGAQEDMLRDHFTNFTKVADGKQLKIQFIDASSKLNASFLASQLDSTKRNICIAGTLDDAFGTKLAQELATINKNYSLRLIGMPTWERMNFSRVNDLEIVYTTPFYYNRSTSLENKLVDDYANATGSKASDFFLRGYESTLRFALLLLDTKKDIASNLTRKGNSVFTQFDIQPVMKDSTNMTLDYFENKHLYFVKVFGGVKNIIN